jgi:hypothetical protein
MLPAVCLRLSLGNPDVHRRREDPSTRPGRRSNTLRKQRQQRQGSLRERGRQRGWERSKVKLCGSGAVWAQSDFL